MLITITEIQALKKCISKCEEIRLVNHRIEELWTKHHDAEQRNDQTSIDFFYKKIVGLQEEREDLTRSYAEYKREKLWTPESDY
jgi:hypothetical protein